MLYQNWLLIKISAFCTSLKMKCRHKKWTEMFQGNQISMSYIDLIYSSVHFLLFWPETVDLMVKLIELIGQLVENVNSVINAVETWLFYYVCGWFLARKSCSLSWVFWSITGMVVPQTLALSNVTSTSFMGAKDENTFPCRDECWCLMALGAEMYDDYNPWV